MPVRLPVESLTIRLKPVGVMNQPCCSRWHACRAIWLRTAGKTAGCGEILRIKVALM